MVRQDGAFAGFMAAWLAVTASPPAAQSSRDRILDALRSEDPAVRRSGLDQAAAAGNPEAAGAVAALVTDPDDQIQLTAIVTLLDLLLAAPAQREEAERGRRTTGGARRAFDASREPARPVPANAFAPVAAAMSDTNPQVRQEAGYAFALLASTRHGLVPEAAMATAAKALEDMLSAADVETRVAAMSTIGRVFRAEPSGPPRVPSRLPEPLLEGLIGAMNQSDPAEQAAAMEALGRVRETRALDALTERFAFHRAQGPTTLAVAALDALARLAHPSTTEAVRALATDPWAMNGDPYLAVLFARERLLADGSTATLREAAKIHLFAERATAYLVELGATP
jgi:HEAT repeat protein